MKKISEERLVRIAWAIYRGKSFNPREPVPPSWLIPEEEDAHWPYATVRKLCLQQARAAFLAMAAQPAANSHGSPWDHVQPTA